MIGVSTLPVHVLILSSSFLFFAIQTKYGISYGWNQNYVRLSGVTDPRIK